ncbi:metal ABC transporter permease [Christensenellaceae bacterium OttesenSCG-928-M15]|nr:metal ABC transporter permease [Christensenellaceae bacterium OttesenSCG-928-M15]
MWIIEMFELPFIARAAVVGVLVSLCAAVLGVSRVLKRYSMIGDGLSHVGFGALAIATALNMAPLPVTIPVVVVAAFLLLRLSQNSKVQADAAIAMVSTASLAIGVTVVSLTTGTNADVNSYLFGSILSVSPSDAVLSVVLCLLVLIVFILFYSRIFAVTFDETFAGATGAHEKGYNMVIALLTALVIVLGMRMMGALLISSLVIFPALTAMRLFKSYLKVTLASAVISVVCFLLGLIFSYGFNTPSGASIVIVNILAFLLCSAISWIKSRM